MKIEAFDNMRKKYNVIQKMLNANSFRMIKALNHWREVTICERQRR